MFVYFPQTLRSYLFRSLPEKHLRLKIRSSRPIIPRRLRHHPGRKLDIIIQQNKRKQQFDFLRREKASRTSILPMPKIDMRC